ncbi:MAG: cytidine deaminase [Betaproteobacteria bacterium]|nr:cytidine deaminase [Betaproteobacteria bacterium]MBK7793396.1 cytidine deaminase [Betaproteobacteria bacterium]
MKAPLSLAAEAAPETGPASLAAADLALVDAARRIIALRRRPEWHSVGCALRTRSGRVFTSVHVGAYVGRIDVCAEAIAIGMGAAEGDTDIETIVAVNKDGHVVAPCGMCRELIADYGPGANVIVPGPQGDHPVPIASLLPNKYTRHDDR